MKEERQTHINMSSLRNLKGTELSRYDTTMRERGKERNGGGGTAGVEEEKRRENEVEARMRQWASR